ncbi:MAG: hypothetical protein QXO40_04440 [Candidatus Aenigmatarchaeota archaeon]
MKWVIFLFLLFSNLVFPHKVNIFAYKEGNKIFVEGYFPDGRPLKNSVVTIYDEKGNKIIEGKTDENGIFSFTMPDVNKIKIVLTGDEGHKAEKFFEIKEDKPLKSEEGKRVEYKSFDKEDLIKAIEEIIEKHMNNFLKEYKKDKEKERIKDIIAGIGYIIGIFGLYFYFIGKKNVSR